MTLSLCVSFLLAKAFSASCTVLRKVELICERTSSDADAKALFLFLLFPPRLTGVLDFSLPVLFARETGVPFEDVFVDPEREAFFREEIFREDGDGPFLLVLDAEGSRTALLYFAPSEAPLEDDFRLLGCVIIYLSLSAA